MVVIDYYTQFVFNCAAILPVLSHEKNNVQKIIEYYKNRTLLNNELLIVMIQVLCNNQKSVLDFLLKVLFQFIQRLLEHYFFLVEKYNM